MLIQFSVTNYSSLREETILSMSAGTGREHAERIFEQNGEKILPVAAIYGPNAAGKSNIFKALTAAIITVRTSSSRQINDKMPWIVPFLFDQTSNMKPTKFDIIFTTKKSKYQYGFSSDINKIYEEYLYEYKSSRPSMIFERIEGDIYQFTKQNEKLLKTYEDKNTSNKLFLATATAWNCDLTKDAYMWFAEAIDTYNELSINNPEHLLQLEAAGDEAKPFMHSLLRNADLHIADYTIHSKPIEKPIEFPIPLEIKFPADAAPMAKQIEISTIHEIGSKEDRAIYKLPLEAESEGTQKLIFWGPLIKGALEKGKTLVVDEFDNSLHPLLMDYLIELFNSKESNPNGAQLIFNTHDVNTLSLEKFRRDQIYFVERDSNTGVTELYSLDEFSARKTENIQKGYLLGRYGAIPFIRAEELEW